MPSHTRRFRFQAAVLWEAAGIDGYGEPTVGDPEEIRVRWVSKQSQALDPQGSVVTVDATAVVAQDIPMGSWMWLGAMDDLPGTTGLPETGLYEVRTVNTTGDWRNRERRRTVGLVRLGAEGRT